MVVKLLALLAFSPLFLAKACIDLVSFANQYLLDYLPGASWRAAASPSIDDRSRTTHPLTPISTFNTQKQASSTPPTPGSCSPSPKPSTAPRASPRAPSTPPSSARPSPSCAGGGPSSSRRWPPRSAGYGAASAPSPDGRGACVRVRACEKKIFSRGAALDRLSCMMHPILPTTTTTTTPIPLPKPQHTHTHTQTHTHTDTHTHTHTTRRAQVCAAYLVLRHRLFPSLRRKLTDEVWPWVNAAVVRPVWKAYV